MDPGLLSIGPASAALVSAGTVALAEIGDKTQLLALLLAARFRRPLVIAELALSVTVRAEDDFISGQRYAPTIKASS